jgi:hypothetical protein
LGNQKILGYDYISALSVNQGSYISGGSLATASTPNPVRAGNHLKPWTSRSMFPAFKNRFSVTYDWCKRNIKGYANTRKKRCPPFFWRFDEPLENAADLRTKGF